MKIQIYLLLAAVLLLGACKKEILQLPNPNSPTPDASLVTEGGIDAFAQGIFYKWIAFETGDGAVPIEETQAALARFHPTLTIATIPRVKRPLDAEANFAALWRAIG